MCNWVKRLINITLKSTNLLAKLLNKQVITELKDSYKQLRPKNIESLVIVVKKTYRIKPKARTLQIVKQKKSVNVIILFELVKAIEDSLIEINRILLK